MIINGCFPAKEPFKNDCGMVELTPKTRMMMRCRRILCYIRTSRTKPINLSVSANIDGLRWLVLPQHATILRQVQLLLRAMPKRPDLDSFWMNRSMALNKMTIRIIVYKARFPLPKPAFTLYHIQYLFSTILFNESTILISHNVTRQEYRHRRRRRSIRITHRQISARIRKIRRYSYHPFRKLQYLPISS